MKKTVSILILCLAQLLSGATGSLNAFNSGELSPLLEGRTDIQKYYSGARTIENFLVLTHGGVTRRPGTKYIADAKESDVACRLVPFEFSVTQAYILEFGNLYIRVYAEGGQVLDGASPVEITTTYLTADLFELQFAQSADTLYIVHPEYAPRTLTRTSNTAWTLAEIAFERGPFLTANEGTTTITPSATTGSVTLTASTATFNANHVGALWEITHVVAAENVTGNFTGTGQSSTVNVQLGRNFDFSTHGTWTGTISLQKSYDSGSTWNDVITRHYEKDGNLQFSDSETVDDAIYRLNMSVYTAGTLKYNLTARSHELDGVAKITAFTSTTVVTATVQNALGSTDATKIWAEGAWSPDEGYPTCVSFFEERLTLAASANKPQTVWMSKTDDWVNFLAGTDDDASVAYTIASDQVNAIRWIASQTALLIGTTGGEWKMSGSNQGEPITPSSVSVRRQSAYGSAYVQPVITSSVLLYVQRQGRRMRELAYDFQTDTWVSPNLTILSEHILDSGVTQVAMQRTPDPMLWCVRADGDLAVFTYNREQDILAWSRSILADADVESLAIIPGSSEDEIWVSVERTIGGGTVRYIEQFQPRDWGDSARDAWFVDSGLQFDGGAAATITQITQADPAAVSCVNSFSDGDQIRITGITGMTEVNNNVYTVESPSTTSFTLRDSTNAVDINSVGFSAYSAGSSGKAEQQENTFSTLSHLEGQLVAVAGDGGNYGTATVSSSTVILTDFFNTVQIGKGYTAKLLPQRIDVIGQGTNDLTKRIDHVSARLHETVNLDIGTSWTSFDPVIFRDADHSLEAPPPLYSGDKRVLFRGSYERESLIYLQSRKPQPCTILSVYPTFSIGN